MVAERGPAALRGRARHTLALGFSLAVAVLVVAQFFYIFEPPASDLVLRLAYEEVGQHERLYSHQAPNQEQTPAEISLALSSIDDPFTPLFPKRLEGGSYRLVALTRTTLMGEPALLLRLVDGGQERPLSLFVMAMEERYLPLDNTFQQRGPWLVSHWREEGLFYSLVAQP